MHCSFSHVIIVTLSSQRTAYCPDSHRMKKVNYTPFQQLHYDYVTPARDLLPFTLSIPPWFNLVLSFIGRPFYNSKSSIPNGSASPFGRIMFRPPSFAMTPGSRSSSAAAAARTHPHQSLGRSPLLLPPLGEVDKLA